MTPKELRELAQGAGCYLTLPRKRLPRGDRVRLSKLGGPLGRICTVNEVKVGFNVVAWFDGPELIQWLDKMESRA